MIVMMWIMMVTTVKIMITIKITMMMVMCL